MKKMTILLVSVTTMLNLFAQKTTKESGNEKPKVDVLLKTNGDELMGKVTEIGDSEVKFSYEGESLVYALKKSDIVKVTFASGRIEFFNGPGSAKSASSSTDSNTGTINAQQPAQKDNNAGLADYHNKVAVLPFGFIKDNQDVGDEIKYKVQEDVYTFLNKHAVGLTILDPRTSNALLAKAGVSRNNLMEFTMDEICNILHVEYVVEGIVTQNKGMATTSTYGGYNSNKKKDGDRKGSIYGSSMFAQRYSMRVSINIYTDKNSNIYSQSRTGLLTTIDGSYSSPMEYLLKRCPLYKK